MGRMTDHRCERVTRRNVQCTRAALRFSPFCWLHYPRGYNWTPSVLTLVIGLAIGALVSAYYFERSVDLTFAVANASRPHSLPRLTSLSSSPASGWQFMDLQLAGCRDVHSMVIFPLDLPTSGDGLPLLTYNLRRDDGVVIAEFVDGVVTLTPGLGYDVNSDEDNLEIVSPERVPVLQASRSDKHDELHIYTVSRDAKEPDRWTELRILCADKNSCLPPNSCDPAVTSSIMDQLGRT